MRITLVEYSSGVDLNSVFSDDFSFAAMSAVIEKANRKVKQHLGIQRNVFAIYGGKLRALGVAGTIRLTKDIELEIVPKLLDGNTDSNWKESLFVLAALSKHGAIINNEHIRSSTAYKDSLYDIAGRILAQEYCRHKRTYLRQYRRESYSDFSIDGDIKFDVLFEKNPDGITQERIMFDRINPYNATIQSAMHKVLPHVMDTSTREVLFRAITELGRQASHSFPKLRVPARNAEWTTIYELSYDIVRGMGTSFNSGEILSPGFMVNTWQIWEWLITIAMKMGFRNAYRIRSQNCTPWGEKRASNRIYNVNIFPDVSVYDYTQQIPLLLVDAKYKDLFSKSVPEISREDLYEAYAFCSATGATKIYLAYPSFAADDMEVGKISEEARYTVQEKQIIALKVEFGSVSRNGYISMFCRNFCDNLAAIAL